MNNLSLNRILKLIKFEFLLHRKYYLMLFIGAFILVTSYLTYNLSHQMTDMIPFGMKNNFYTGPYFFYVIAVFIFVTGQSFMDLRSKAGAERYILLPASVSEKLISQGFVKFGVTFLVMPVIFALSALLARWVAVEHLSHWTGSITNIEIISSKVLFLDKDNLPPIGFVFFIGFFLFVSSALFTGSQYYGKWNPVLSPLFLILFSLSTALSPYLVSSLFSEKPRTVGEFLSVNKEITILGQEAPANIFALLVLFYLGFLLSCLISHYKLKEREV